MVFAESLILKSLDSVELFSSIKKEWLPPIALPLYDYVHKFIKDYGRPPSVETLSLEGFDTSTTGEDRDYYLSKVLEAVSFRLYESLTEELDKLSNPRDPLTLKSLIKEYDALLDETIQSSDDEFEDWVADEVDRLRSETYLSSCNLTIPTGVACIDGVIGGLRKGGLYVIAGRPKSGKTSLLATFAVAAYGRNVTHTSVDRRRVFFSSAEMQVADLARSIAVASGAGRVGGLNSSRFQILSEVFSKEDFCIKRFRFGTKLAEVRAALLKFNADVFFIDSAYRLSPEKPTGNMYTDVASVVIELTELAKDLAIPVVCSEQLSRTAGKKLTEYSQSIANTDKFAQEASGVFVLDPAAAEWESQQERDNFVLVRVDVNRFGPTLDAVKLTKPSLTGSSGFEVPRVEGEEPDSSPDVQSIRASRGTFTSGDMDRT